jgi:hypothetical protein
VTGIALALDDALSVTVERTPSERCAYTVVHDGESVAEYETSADPRTAGGHVSLRNVVYRNVAGYEKGAVGDLLAAAVEANEDALTAELGPR